MKEYNGKVTFQGSPLTLVGNEIKVGDKAPDVELLSNDLQPVKISSYRGKVLVISAVPSLDTSVCDMETRRFNDEGAKLGGNVKILTVSMDLPFAQKRWCGAADISHVQTVSDHRNATFGEAYGVLIKELRLLARTVYVVDQKGIIKYIQQVREITTEPNYNEVLAAVKELL